MVIQIQVANSGRLVKNTLAALKACEAGNRQQFDNSFSEVVQTMRDINAVMETMWVHSKPEDYNDFRTFIMGTKNQPMFPNGVVYEGVSTEPTFFRGESGANDSIIPTMDNFSQLTSNMPKNPLTEILRDFRTYRPSNHNQFVSMVEQRAAELSVREFALASPSTAILYLQLLDQIRDFRQRHWNFTKNYIIKYSTHPVATGGSPIVTWLPNQLSVVLNAMMSIKKRVKVSELDPFERTVFEECLERADTQSRVLQRDVESFASKLGEKAVKATIN